MNWFNKNYDEANAKKKPEAQSRGKGGESNSVSKVVVKNKEETKRVLFAADFQYETDNKSEYNGRGNKDHFMVNNNNSAIAKSVTRLTPVTVVVVSSKDGGI